MVIQNAVEFVLLCIKVQYQMSTRRNQLEVHVLTFFVLTDIEFPPTPFPFI